MRKVLEIEINKTFEKTQKVEGQEIGKASDKKKQKG